MIYKKRIESILEDIVYKEKPTLAEGEISDIIDEFDSDKNKGVYKFLKETYQYLLLPEEKKSSNELPIYVVNAVIDKYKSTKRYLTRINPVMKKKKTAEEIEKESSVKGVYYGILRILYR